MPKLRCYCGFVHNLSPIPDDGWVTVRDKDYEALLDAKRVLHEVSEGKGMPSDDNARVSEYDEAMGFSTSLEGSLYECPRCGTLLWRKPGSQAYLSFKPVDPMSDE